MDTENAARLSRGTCTALLLLLAGCTSVRPAKVPPASVGQVSATVVVSAEAQPVFPELVDPRPATIQRLLQRTTSNGVCFSGGGSRSQTAVVGQLRALHAMGLVKSTRYMTAVSGATWTMLPFFYYRAGPSDDDEFLGAHVTAEQRGRWSFTDENGESWATLRATSVGHAATADFRKPFLHSLFHGHAHEAWQTATGTSYFAPFGLYDPHHHRFFSLDDETVGDILSRHGTLQPDWSADDFDTVRPDRPYPIVTATIIWPTIFRDDIDKVLIQHSPMGVGNPPLISLEERALLQKVRQPTGGGFVEPFAFQSFGPLAPPDLETPGSTLVRMPAPENPFTLWQASGMSSAAYAASLARIDPDLLPNAVYWSPARAADTPPRILRFGDGGNLEDLGIMPLLQRQVRKIVAFANYHVPLADLVDASKKHHDADTLIAPLFGVNAKHWPHNQVFAETGYEPLLNSLNDAMQRGGLPMATKRYQVLANSWYGIRPYEVEILWVYNDVSEDWVARLDPEVAALVREGIAGKGPLRDFPHYRTVAENGMHFVKLTPQQVTLMTDMFSWSMQQPGAREMFEDMLAPPQDLQEPRE